MKQAESEAQAREDRLKAALKANMARRKAQAKARTGNSHPEAKSERQAEKDE